MNRHSNHSFPKALTRPRSILSTMITAAAAVFSIHQAQSQDTFTWDGGGADGNWLASPLNWAGNVAPDGNDILNFSGAVNLNTNNDIVGYNGHRIIFAAGAGNFTLGGNALTLSDFGGQAPVISNLSVGSTQTINLGLTLNGTAATFAEINPISGNLILNGTVDLAGTTQLRVTGNSGNVLTFNNVISSSGGANSFALNQDSTVVFNAANTYGGPTFVNAGTLRINSAGSIAGASGLVIGDTSGAADARVEINSPAGGKVMSNTIQFRAGSGGARILANMNTAGTNTFTGAVTLDAFGTLSTEAGGVAALTGAMTINNSAFLDISGGGHAIINGAIGQAAGTAAILSKNNAGTLVLGGNNSYTGGTEVSAGRIFINNAGALGNNPTATNGTVNVSDGAQVIFNGITLNPGAGGSNGGKNFIASGSGPDGRGALVNDYGSIDNNRAIASLTMVGDTTIGGTNQIDIGNGQLGQFLDGGGNTLTVENRSRFNIRGAVTNLPNLVLNKGYTETEALDLPASTTVTVNRRAWLGAWIGSAATRTVNGNVVLNSGGIAPINDVNGLLVIGGPGKTLTINGESHISNQIDAFIDWAGISGTGRLRIDSTIQGAGTLLVNFHSASAADTIINSSGNTFSGEIQVLNRILRIGSGGTTGDLGNTSRVVVGNGTGADGGILAISRSDSFNLDKTIVGSGRVRIMGPGNTTISGNNSYWGNTDVQGGSLIVGSTTAIPDRSFVTVGLAATASVATFALNGNNVLAGGVDDAGTTAAVNRFVNGSATPATLSSYINAGITFGDAGGVFGGPNANDNNFGFTKLGAANFTLAGNTHTYDGVTTINAGQIIMGANGKLGSTVGNTVVNPGGSLAIDSQATGTNGEAVVLNGRGGLVTTHAFFHGALRNGGTAVVGNNVTDVTLGSDAYITGGFEIRNTGSSTNVDLAGKTMWKVANNTLVIADALGGTGNGNIVVRHGTLTIERGTQIDGTGTVSVLGGSTLNLHDNGTPIGFTKSLVLNTGNLTNQSGNHSLAGVSSNGYFTAQNNSAADTLGIGNVSLPSRGGGAYIGTTGAVTVGTVNGVALAAGARPGPGWTAGTATTNATVAMWDGSKIAPVVTTATSVTPLTAMTAASDVFNDVGTDPNRTINTDLTIRSLTNQVDLKVNDGALLRVADGNVVLRGANFWLQTTAGSLGRLTSGRANGELHVSMPETIDARGDAAIRLSVVDNPGASGLFTPVTFVKHGGSGLNNFGGTSAAGSTVNSYTGGSVINNGRVVPQFNSAFGTGEITVRDGGQIATYNLLAANGSHFSNPLDLAGAGAFENAGVLGALRVANSVTFSGNTLLSSETRLHGHGAGDVGTMGGVIRGSGGIDKTGDGFVALVAPNTYTGVTTFTRGTVVTNRLASGGVASGIGAASAAAGNLVFNGGTLRYDGPSVNFDRSFTVDVQGGGILNNYHTGGLTLGGASIAQAAGGDRTLTLSSTAFTSNVLNTVLGDANAGRSSLTVTGMGNWLVTKDQDFTGTLTVNASGNFGGGTYIVGNGGTTGSAGKGIQITLAGAADIAFNRSDNITVEQTISSAANSEIIQMGSGTLTIAGTADNPTGNFRSEGGTTVLAKVSGKNVHAIAVNGIMNAGTLKLAGTGEDQIFNGTAMWMNGGVVDLNGKFEGINRIEGFGGKYTNSAAGTLAELRLGTNTGATVFSGNFIPNVLGGTGTGGYGGVIENGAGTVRVSKEGTGLIVLRGNNTYTGGTDILQGILQVGRQTNAGNLGTGSVFLGGGDSANVGTLRVDRTGTLTMNQLIYGAGNVQMQGEGELRLTAANNWYGTTTLRRGTLTADLAAQNDTLPVFANYSLEGGTLKVVGKAGTATQTISPAGLTVSGVNGFVIAGSNIVGDNNGGSLTIGLPSTWTRGAGGSVDFSSIGAGTTTFSTGIANNNGVIGSAAAAYATLGGTTWAVQTNGIITGLPAAGYNTAAGHFDLGSGLTPVPGGTTVATARLNAPGVSTVDLSAGTTTIAQGGILVTPNVGANDVTVQNGTLATPGNELIVHQHNTAGNLNISAVIGGTQALTKAGNGKLILTGANTSTGAVFINQGTLQVGNAGGSGTLPTGAITNDGTLVIARNAGTFAAPYLLAASNIIGGSGNLLVQGGSGWVDFNRNANTYTGSTTISSGYVQNLNVTTGQVAPVILGDANTGSNPIALVSNHTVATTYNFPIVVSAAGSGPVIIGSSGGTGAVAALYNGTVELNRPTIFAGYHPDRTTFTNSITGNAGLITIDVGTAATPNLPGATPVASAVGVRRVTWEGTNTFVGDVEIRNGSTLQIGLGTAGVFRDQIPDASNVSLFDANSTFQFNNEGEVINNLNGQVGTVVRSIAAGGAHQILSINGGTFDGTYDGGANGGMYIEKNGAGTFSLGGTGDNVTGKVRMNSGTLNLNKASSGSVHAVAVDLTVNGGTVVHTGAGDDQISNGTVVTMNGGLMDLNGKSDTISVLQGRGGVITNNLAATTSTLAIGDTSNVASSIFYGSIQDGAGVMKVTKTSAVAHGLVLAGNNSYTGGTTVDAGTLQIGNGGNTGTAGSGGITLGANTILAIDRSDSFAFNNNVTGAGRVAVNGGEVIMSGTNTYSGTTTVNDAELTITGSIAASAVTVNEGGILSGSGLTGPVALTLGGEIAPGIDGIGALSTGSVNFLEGSKLTIDLGAATGDQILSSGLGFLTGNVDLSLTLTATPGIGSSYTIFDGALPFGGYTSGGRFSFGGNILDEGEQFNVTTGGFSQDFSISYSADGGKDVVMTVVPEPGSAALLLGGLAMLAGRRRRKSD